MEKLEFPNKETALTELERCIQSPYYFYTTYCAVNGEMATTRLSEKEFNELFKNITK